MIGTDGTINSKAYSSVLKSMNPAVEVFGKACPLFVPLVEEGLLHDTVTDEIPLPVSVGAEGKNTSIPWSWAVPIIL